MMILDADTDLQLERTLQVPADVIWRCWTTPEHLQHFFVPKPHKLVCCDIDLHPGGRFNTVFEVEGNEMRNEGVFLELIPGRKLVFTDTYTEGWKPAEHPFMTAILLLEPLNPHATRYVAIARHRNAEARAEHEKMGFHSGWGMVADQLEVYAQML